MAQNSTQTAISSWAEATDSDITSVTIQNQGSHLLEVIATTGAAPSGDGGKIIVPPGGALINEFLSDLFPGIPGADRVWVRGYGPFLISHA